MPLLFFFQPWVAENGYLALTQAPLMGLMCVAVYGALTGQAGWAAVAVGCTPLVRHEAVALLGLWLAYAAWRREWRALAAGVLPVVVYNAAHFAVFGAPASANLTQWRPTTEYGAGGWTHFVPDLWCGVGVPVVLLWGAGLVRVWPARKDWLFVVWYAAYIGLHTVIYRFGLFASGGHGVFLLPTAPMFALVAAQTLAGIQRRALLVLACVAVVGTGLTARATLLFPIDGSLIAAADWLRQTDPQAPVVATHVWFYYTHGLRIPNSTFAGHPSLTDLPVGSYAVWDAKYSDALGLPHAQLTAPGGPWAIRRQFGAHVIVFQKPATR